MQPGKKLMQVLNFSSLAREMHQRLLAAHVQKMRGRCRRVGIPVRNHPVSHRKAGQQRILRDDTGDSAQLVQFIVQNFVPRGNELDGPEEASVVQPFPDRI